MISPWKGATAVWREKRVQASQLGAEGEQNTMPFSITAVPSIWSGPTERNEATHPTIPAGGFRDPVVRRGKDAVQVVTQ